MRARQSLRGSGLRGISLYRSLFIGLFTALTGLVVLVFVQRIQGTAPPAKKSALSEPVVSFVSEVSRGIESLSQVSVNVQLTTISSETVSVGYIITGGTASVVSYGSGLDYQLDEGTLIFPPGSNEETITFQVIDDDLNEADETIEITLSNPQNAAIGEFITHKYEIVDNDRKALVSITDFGAVGDGREDDTAAIQTAVDTVYARGGGVIIFPPGIYLVKTINIRENITYQGYGAILLRPPMQGEIKTFTTRDTAYIGDTDSPALIIKGLTFDGNSQNQGTYNHYELEHGHLVFLNADPDHAGRLQAIVEDCMFQNGVGDGLSVHSNVDVKVYNSRARNVFRGGLVMTGGYSQAEVVDFFTEGEIDPTGIDIEVSKPGYGGTYRVDLMFDGLYLRDGDFDVTLSDGSTLRGNNIISENSPFDMFALDSKVHITNCILHIGPNDGKSNRILLPHDVLYENCDLIVTNQQPSHDYDFFATADIWWQHPSFAPQYNQSLIFRNSRFLVDANLRNSNENVYAIYSRYDLPGANSVLEIDGGCLSEYFDQTVVVEPDGVQARISADNCDASNFVPNTEDVVSEGTGLRGEYYADMELNELVLVQIDPTVDFEWSEKTPSPILPEDYFSIRWVGQIEPKYTDTYTFYTESDDGIRLWVNGQLLVDNWTAHALTENSGQISLVAGQRYNIKLEYFEQAGDATARLSWSSPNQPKQIIPQNQLYFKRTSTQTD